MEIRSISVFYDSQGYPFKDQERTVRYPIFGNAFLGASNTTQIKFYVKEIGGAGATWVANGKLPNGVMGHQVLSGAYDTDLGNGEYYVTFTLSAFFTQYKGDVYISLSGYDGDLSYTEETDGVYTINGTPIIQTTGSIKLNIAYATGLVNGEEEDITFDNFFSLLNGKIDKSAGIMVAPSYSDLRESVGNYNEGQLAYAEEENSFYILESGVWNLHYDLNKYRDNIGYVINPSSVSVGQVFSETQLAELNKPISFVVYNNVLYVKDQVSNSLIHFASALNIVHRTSYLGGGYENINRLEFYVNTTSGVISNGNATNIDFYTKSQTDNLFVDRITQQTISGVKTFSALPQSSVTPTNDNDLTRKGYVDSKVAKTSTASQVYATNSSGNQTTIGYSTNVVANNLVQRDGSGRVKVNTTPTNNDEAVSYNYIQGLQQDLWSEIDNRVIADNTLQGYINTINGKIPSQASSSNQLVDRATMNSTINSSAAFFKGNYNTYADLMAVAWQTTDENAPYYVTNNDYAYINDDETHNNEAWRYIYVSGTGWQAQFRVNEAPLTATQLSALNSGITALLVAQITNNKNNMATTYDPTATYNEYDGVLYDGVLYQCNEDNVTGTWDSTKWSAVNVLQLFQAYKVNVNNVLVQVPTYYDITFATTDWVLDTNDNKYKCTKQTSVLDLDSSDSVVLLPSGYVNEGYMRSFVINITNFDETTGIASFEAIYEPTEQVLATLQFLRR